MLNKFKISNLDEIVLILLAMLKLKQNWSSVFVAVIFCFSIKTIVNCFIFQHYFFYVCSFFFYFLFIDFFFFCQVLLFSQNQNIDGKKEWSYQTRFLSLFEYFFWFFIFNFHHHSVQYEMAALIWRIILFKKG